MASIPNAMMIKGAPDSAGQRMREETRVLDARTFSQSQCTFLFPKSGILAPSAYLTFSMTTADANQRFPLKLGAMSCIREMRLELGTKVWSTCQQANGLRACLKNFKDPNDSQLKEANRTGAFRNVMVEDQLGGGGALEAGVLSGRFTMDSTTPGIVRQNNLYANGAGAGTANTSEIQVPYVPATTERATMEATVFLADIFPFLYQLQLPLELLEDQLRLIVVWEDDDSGGRVVPAAGNPFVAGNNIIESKTKCVVDLIYFEDPEGEDTLGSIQALMEGPGINLVYTDWVQVNGAMQPVNNPGVNAVTTQTNDTLVTLAGLVMRNMYLAVSPSEATLGNPLLGRHCAIASQGNTTLQVKINSVPYFTRPIDSDAKLWNELSLTHNLPYSVGMQDYSFKGLNGALNQQLYGVANTYLTKGYLSPYSRSLMSGFPMSGTVTPYAAGPPIVPSVVAYNGLTGHQAYRGVNFTWTNQNIAGAGIAVGQSPIIVQHRYDRSAEDHANAYVLRMWMEVERMCSLRSASRGKGQVYFSSG